MRWLAIGWVLVAGLVILLGWFFLIPVRPGQPRPFLPSSRALPPEEREVAGRSVIPSTQDELAGSNPPTAESVLQSYWGDEWPNVRDRLLAAGKDLDQPMRLSPWEEVEPKLEEHLRVTEPMEQSLRSMYLDWPGVLTSEWARQHLGARTDLDQTELDQLESIARDFNAEMDAWITEYVHDLDQILRHVRLAGRYEKTPFSTQALANLRSDPAFFSTSFGAGGWTVKVRLYNSDYPEMLETQKRILSRRGEREAALRKWVQLRR